MSTADAADTATPERRLVAAWVTAAREDLAVLCLRLAQEGLSPADWATAAAGVLGELEEAVSLHAVRDWPVTDGPARTLAEQLAMNRKLLPALTTQAAYLPEAKLAALPVELVPDLAPLEDMTDPSPPPPPVRWRGLWDAAERYWPEDLVTTGGGCFWLCRSMVRGLPPAIGVSQDARFYWDLALAPGEGGTTLRAGRGPAPAWWSEQARAGDGWLDLDSGHLYEPSGAGDA